MFKASAYTMEALENSARRADFAVLVTTPDDTVSTRGENLAAPRDNVIFELGLFIGALGRERTFIVNSGALKLPTDLQGVTWLSYDSHRSDDNLHAAVQPAALAITERVKAVGQRQAAPLSRGPYGSQPRALTREIERICSDAKAQGWRIKTRSDTTLRLMSARGRRYTFSIGEAESSRLRLREFAAELRSGGLRVNQSVRRPPHDSPSPS